MSQSGEGWVNSALSLASETAGKFTWCAVRCVYHQRQKVKSQCIQPWYAYSIKFRWALCRDSKPHIFFLQFSVCAQEVYMTQIASVENILVFMIVVSHTSLGLLWIMTWSEFPKKKVLIVLVTMHIRNVPKFRKRMKNNGKKNHKLDFKPVKLTYNL